MKIFSITDHIADADSPLSSSPVWTMLPDSSIIRSGNIFFLPDLTHRYEAMPVMAVKIGKLGKSVTPRFASRYMAEVTAALQICDITRLEYLRSRSLPWVMAMGFDRSLVTGDFLPAEELQPLDSVCIEVTDGEGVPLMSWNAADMPSDIAHVVEAVSRDNTLKNGDLILPLLPRQGILLKPGMMLSASVNGRHVLGLKVK